MGPPVVWKSKDFVNWSFEGTILEEIDWNKPYLYTNDKGEKKYGFYRYWAPGRAVKIDNLYYLFPTIVSPDGTCPVYTLVSKHPMGRSGFRMVTVSFGDNSPSGWSLSQPLVPDIDVEPFIDDDGQNYVYWRQRQAAKVNRDFSKIEGEVITMPTKRTEYSEGPTLFKREGIYYYIYTQGGHQNYRNAYMMSKESPLKGFEAPGETMFLSPRRSRTGCGAPGMGTFFMMPTPTATFLPTLNLVKGVLPGRCSWTKWSLTPMEPYKLLSRDSKVWVT